MYKRLSLHIILFVVVLVGSKLFAQSKNELIEKSIVNAWVKECLVLTQNCVGFSPPVSARALAYFSINLHEASVDILPGTTSMSGKLNGFKRTVYPDKNKTYILSQVLNTSAYTMAKLLYENMPEENIIRIEALKDSIDKQIKPKNSKKIILSSNEYAVLLTTEIFEWSKLDGGHQGFQRNFPKEFNPVVCDSCWTRTPSSFLPSMLPYWGENRLMIASNAHVDYTMQPIRFSTDTSSVMYKHNFEILTLTKARNKEHEIIAEYWDDSPGYSRTPSGHIYSVTEQLTKIKNVGLNEILRLYAVLGVALNDAFILCWKYKYEYNVLRPTTYIQRYMDKSFNSFIGTPPFPEFPSGHSFQSGAAEPVLIFFFTNDIEFTDSTQVQRKDIVGTPRTYSKISDMINEISISRMYGGIHYRYTLDETLKYGRLLGNNTINSLISK